MTGQFNELPSNLLARADDALRMEFRSLNPHAELESYWTLETFQVDRIQQSVAGVTLYYVRQKGMRRDKAVIIQSNWQGMESFTVTA